jgi:hypothetical protein
MSPGSAAAAQVEAARAAASRAHNADGLGLAGVRLVAMATEIEELIGSCDAFVFDCDGVIWSGDHLLVQSREALALLRYLTGRKPAIFV